jgi:hypothetical protein
MGMNPSKHPLRVFAANWLAREPEIGVSDCGRRCFVTRPKVCAAARVVSRPVIIARFAAQYKLVLGSPLGAVE